jgi:hypothetical protein
VRPSVIPPPVTPRTSAALHLDPEPVPPDPGAQRKRTAIPRGTVQDGFDGVLGRYPVGIEAARVRWHSQQGPDELADALALAGIPLLIPGRSSRR